MSWLYSKRIRKDFSQIFNRFWWIFFVAAAATAPEKKSTYSFNCEKLRIFNREKFQDILNTNANQIIRELNISFDDTDPGIKFEDVSLITVGVLGVNKLNKNCLNPNKILKGLPENELVKDNPLNLSENAKILFYILGIEIYEHIKDLNFGTIGFYSEKVKQWENIKLPEQLKNYREFLGLTDSDIVKVELAYDQIVNKGHFP